MIKKIWELFKQWKFTVDGYDMFSFLQYFTLPFNFKQETVFQED